MADLFYSSIAWLQLRRRVLGRDGYKCTICGVSVKEKGSSQIDHVIPRKQRPDLALNISNLRTLCRVCHNKFDQARGHKTRIKYPVNEDGFPPGWCDED